MGTKTSYAFGTKPCLKAIESYVKRINNSCTRHTDIYFYHKT